MPCDQVLTNTVDLGQIGNMDLLEKALKRQYGKVNRYGDQFTFYANGYSVTLAGGQAESRMSERQLQALVADVKQAYGCETVHETSDQWGWLVEQEADSESVAQYRR